jgi:hypothetical protein
MGRSRNNKKNNEHEEQTIQELKEANRRLKSDNRKLKAQIATLEEAFNKTSHYLKNNTDGISVETIIDGVNKGVTLKEIQTCKKCGSATIKEHKIHGVGILRLCTNCNDRGIVKRENTNDT